MLRLQGDHIFQGFLPAFQGLARQAVDQIQGKIFIACPADPLHRIDHLLKIVGTAQLFEDLIIVALHAQADPVEALAF